jgi:hypothetical protein
MSAVGKKEFRVDSVQLKHAIQRDIAEEARGMTPAERLDYYVSLSEKWHADHKMTRTKRSTKGT